MIPYDDAYRCIGCGRYIGLHTRDGMLVGLEYHGVHVEAESTYVGHGLSGYGMVHQRGRLVCNWRSR